MALNKYSKINSILEQNGEKYENNNVYHYTTGNGLKSIIEKNQLWLSERRYMNDVLEVKYAQDLIKNYYKKKYSFSEKDVEELFIKDNMQYVFSTTTAKDVINMWSYYSGTDAYCICFDRSELRDFFLEHMLEEEELFYGKVIYSRTKQRNILSKVCDDLLDAYGSDDDFYEKIYKNSNNKRYTDPEYIYKFFYSLFKQAGHSCEKEVRFVIDSTDEPKGFEIKKGLFVPTYKIGEKSYPLPIKEIIIGPNNHEEIAEKSLQMFLKLNNYEDITISRSKLSVR